MFLAAPHKEITILSDRGITMRYQTYLVCKAYIPFNDCIVYLSLYL